MPAFIDSSGKEMTDEDASQYFTKALAMVLGEPVIASVRRCPDPFDPTMEQTHLSIVPSTRQGDLTPEQHKRVGAFCKWLGFGNMARSD